jgi:hypothetical protein
MFTMNIIEYYYDEDHKRLSVEFSTDEDGDTFYRVLQLGYDEVEYYSPEIIDEVDLEDIDEDFIIELIEQYLKENDLPEEKTL